MGDLNWGMIRSWATFESLVRTIVFFEDPSAKLFGRPGSDGGQDARSSDGKRVFQAKYHERDSAADVIRDAKQELKKIGEYRTAGHKRCAQWQGVTHWRLVTNVALDAAGEQRWRDEIVPLFRNQGLVADCWSRSNLTAWIAEHPEIGQAYFEGETRVFLSLPEVRERLLQEEPFLKRDELGKFFGRENELTQIRDFLSSDKVFLVVHGPGGIGKTRLLFEAGMQLESGEANQEPWQVLWANVRSMDASSAWFRAIVPERPTLLLLNDPEDEKILQRLSEQLSGRMKKWKIAVAVRSSNDPVLRFLSGPRVKERVQELSIAKLSGHAAKEMCDDLLRPVVSNAGRRQEIAQQLAELFSCHPIWMTLAAHLLKKNGNLDDLPNKAAELARAYVEEIRNGVWGRDQLRSEKILHLLRWIALLGVVNREDDGCIELLREKSDLQSSDEVRIILKQLVEKRVLVQRGVRNRLVELKPDVLRDYLLLDWLSHDVGYGNDPIQLTSDAKDLIHELCQDVKAGNFRGANYSVLASLGRTDRISQFAGREIPLLREFLQEAQNLIGEMSLSSRIVLAKALEGIAGYRPSEIVGLVQTLRSSSVASEVFSSFLPDWRIEQIDLILELSWLLFLAAQGARSPEECTVVFDELCQLICAEAEIKKQRGKLPNDGKRAAELTARLIGGGPQFGSSFEEDAKRRADEVLDAVATTSPMEGGLALIDAVVRPIVSLERHQIWFKDNQEICFRTSLVLPHEPAWQARGKILQQIQEILEAQDTPLETRILLWGVFAGTHCNVHRIIKEHAARLNEFSPGLEQELYSQLLQNLDWAYGVLELRRADVRELSAARRMWSWHYEVGTDEKLKEASGRLENLYTRNDLAREFEPLLNWLGGEVQQRSREKAESLAAAADPAVAIEDFLNRAKQFLNGEEEFTRLYSVAHELGKLVPSCEAIENFVRKSLTQSSVSPRTQFGIEVAVCWMLWIRRSVNAAAAYELTKKLFEICGSAEQKLNLLMRFYARVPGSTPEERVWLRSHDSLFSQHGGSSQFISVLGATFFDDWLTLKSVIEKTLLDTPCTQRVEVVSGLVGAVYRALVVEKIGPPDGELGTWLLEQLLQLPDVDAIDSHTKWQIEQLDRVSLPWLIGALKRREKIVATNENFRSFHPVIEAARLSCYVKSLSEADAADSIIGQAVVELVDLAAEHGSVGYCFHTILHNVDPGGVMVPTEIARRFANEVSPETVVNLASMGGAYALGNDAWRKIAKPVIEYAMQKVDERRRAFVFGGLFDRDRGAWWGPVGGVAPIFFAELKSAKEHLESETEDAFRPFWEWRLSIAEQAIKTEEERTKEERGE